MQQANCKASSFLALVVCFFSLVLASAIQSQTVAPLPQPYLHHSFAALTGGTRIRDVTLTGTATYYGGSATESPRRPVAVREVPSTRLGPRT